MKDRDIILEVLKRNISTEVNPNRKYISAYVLEDVAEQIQKALHQEPSKEVEKEEPKYSISDNIYEILTHNTEWTNVLPDDIASNEGLMVTVAKVISKQLGEKPSQRIKELEEESEPIDLGDIENYSSGIINDYGGGNVGWWQDYIRSEVERCNEYWRDFIESTK